MLSATTYSRVVRAMTAAWFAVLAAGASSCEEDLLSELPPAEQTDLAFVRHLFSGGQPDHPVWSPDGEKLAFIAKRTGQSQIYVGDERGSDAVAITTEAGTNSSPSWSPDGTWIAFASIRIHWDIWRVATDGSFEEPLTNDPDEDRDPAVGPDGAIVFASDRGTGAGGERSFNLWLLDAPGADPVRLTLSDADDRGPAWSPDGREVVFHRFDRDSSALWIVDRATRRVRGLTNPQLTLDQDPAWSADGRFIAFASNRDGSWDLWIIAADRTSELPRQLTDSDWNDRRPRWSADARTENASLVFASDRDSQPGIWVAWGLIR